MAPGAFVFAQEAVVAPERITDLQVNGLARVSRDQALEAIRLRPGDTFSARAVDEAIRRLAAMNSFLPTGINVRREPFQEGVRLIFDLKEQPIVSALRFEGARAFKEGKLLEAVGLKAGGFADVGRARESTRNIEDLYRAQGYQFVEVSRQDNVDGPRNTDEIVFTIKEGPQVALKGVRFEGNKAFDSKKLLGQMKMSESGGKIFDESVFRDDLVRVRQFYRSQGYLDAEVTGDYEYSPDKTQITAIVKITEGEPYRVGSIAIEGNETISSSELMGDLKLKSGGVFSGEDLDRDVQAIVKRYGARGYSDVRVEVKQSFPEPGVVDVTFVVSESRQTKMGLIEIRGNSKTKDKVIRREFDVYPGDLFDQSKVDLALDRLRGLGYFSKVESTVRRGEYPDERDLVVEVDEGRTGHIGFGGGVSSDAGVMGLLELDLENFDISDWPKSWKDLWNGNSFVGGGQKLSIQLEPGTELNQGRIYFFEPRLFDTHYSFASDLYLWTRTRDSYDEARFGSRYTFGRQITERLLAKLSLRLEEVKISKLDSGAPADVLAVKGKSHIQSLTFALDYDHTDSRMTPSKGYRLGGSFETAVGDWHYVKAQGAGTYYQTLYTRADGRKHVLALTGRAGAVKPFGSSDEVPTFDRFYAGDRNSLRGFAYRGVGPKQGDTFVGGEFMALGSVEYLFPVWQSDYRGKPYEMIRGVLFLDVGKVAYKLNDIGADKMRASAGFGVRLVIPALGKVPIALDVGFPISKEPGDKTQFFSFSLGAEF